ncbi:ATP-binding protein [Streptantibioticus parmotrematis]
MLMVRRGSSTGVSRPASGLAWLLPALAVAVCTAVVAAATTSAARAPVVWCGVAALVVVAAVSVVGSRRGRALADLRRRYDRQEQSIARRLARHDEETARIAEVLLPIGLTRLRKGESPLDVLESMATQEVASGTPFNASHRRVLREVLEIVSTEEDQRDSAQRAFVNIARRVQAITHQQAQDLREMEDRHGADPEVFGDLLRIDHGTALIGRLADSIAVLGGARPGRQWSRPVPLFSVLRGAMSRILDYTRVELHSVTEIAIVGPAVEPLIHGLAELLDNATRYSPPQTMVHLTAVEVQSGIAVEIEDGGVSLSEEARLRAERLLLQAQAGIDLNDLGETPRLGLAVVGRLCQLYGFQVALRPSAYGGVRAVLIVPSEYLTTAPAPGRAHGIGAVSAGTRTEKAPPRTTLPRISTPQRPVQHPGVRSGSRAARTSVPKPPPPPSFEDDIPIVTERTANGLPQRRRRLPGVMTRGHARPATGSAPSAPAAPPSVRPADPAAPKPSEDPVQPGMWLAAFTSAVAGESPAPGEACDKSDESSDKPDKGE